MHDVLSGKLVTGVFHMANMTPMMWYSKKQATAETATYSAEFLSARTCFEQIIDLRNSFRYLGVPVCENSYVWGDNESQVKSSIFPYARLHKRHNILSYHFVRNMVAQGYINLSHIASEYNVADVLSKNWGFKSCYKNLIKLFLSYHGNGSHYDTFGINKLLDAGLDIEFEFNIQEFHDNDLKIVFEGSETINTNPPIIYK